MGQSFMENRFLECVLCVFLFHALAIVFFCFETALRPPRSTSGQRMCRATSPTKSLSLILLSPIGLRVWAWSLVRNLQARLGQADRSLGKPFSEVTNLCPKPVGPCSSLATAWAMQKASFHAIFGRSQERSRKIANPNELFHHMA